MTLVEHFTSGAETFAGIDGDTELVYHVLDAPTAIDARNFVRLAVPLVLPESGFVRKTIMTTPKGGRIYECKVKYSKIENKIRLSIDCTPEKVKVTKSKASFGNFKVRELSEITLALAGNIDANATEISFAFGSNVPGDTPFVVILGTEKILATGRPDDDVPETVTVERGFADTSAASHLDGDLATLLIPGPDFGGLVNVNKDKVEGVDWYVSARKFTLQWSSKWGSLDENYVRMVENMEGCVNDADIALTVRGQDDVYLRGELVFLGGTFEEGSDDGANITLKFEVQRNAEISIGERDGTNTTWRSKIYKRGWDFGWIRTVTVNGQGVQVEVPDSIHVDQIADYVDFGQLGIFDVLIAEEEARDEEEEE